MKNLARKTYLLLIIFVAASCVDRPTNYDPDFHEREIILDEKVEEISELGGMILPDELLDMMIADLENIEENEIEEYLDTLKASMISLVDSTSKYSNTDELKKEIMRFQEEVNKQKSKTGNGLSCNNDLRFGYAKANEITGNAHAALIAGLNMTNGGGVETVYDFVHMDRGVYYYSVCGLGISLGPQIGGSLGVGFKGISKFITNIGLNQEDEIDRFSGPSISSSVGITAALKVKIGASAGVSIATTRGLLSSSDVPIFLSGSKCPVGFEQPIDNRSPTTYSLSVGAGVGIGAGIKGAIVREELASMSYSIDELYTNFGGSRWGRWGRRSAAFSMAAEIISPFSVSGLSSASSGFDLVASAMAVAYGFIDPSDCPEPAYLPIVSSTNISNIESDSFIATAEILDDGNDTITEIGICWSENTSPNLNDNCESSNTGEDFFTVTATDLKPGTIYYVRAFATNNAGTAFGNQGDIRTKSDISIPIIETNSVTSITANSAVSGGNITDDGGGDIHDRGVCWSTTQSPDLNDYCSSSGSGMGQFSTNIDELFPSTTYYVRAYASNDAGIGYGNQQSFITDDGVDDVPPGVNDFLTPEEKSTLQDQGLTIYTGLNPPNVEGYYYANSLETADGGMSFINYSYRYFDQTSGLSIKSSHISEDGTDVAEGKGAFIAGTGSTFSIYMESVSEIDEGTHIVRFESARIYSGTISANGIIGFQFGFIVTDKQNDLNNNFMNVGDTRVIYETDGLAERVDEFPFSPKVIGTSNNYSIYRID